MIAVVQRVRCATVRLRGAEALATIDAGLLVLLCVEVGDGEAQCRWMARKIRSLRIFDDGLGRMNLDLAAIGGKVLVVSQFTLAADVASGNRPSFSGAAPAPIAEPLLQRCVSLIAESGIEVAAGRFGAAMEIELVNDGPVTILLRAPGGGRAIAGPTDRGASRDNASGDGSR